MTLRKNYEGFIESPKEEENTPENSGDAEAKYVPSDNLPVGFISQDDGNADATPTEKAPDDIVIAGDEEKSSVAGDEQLPEAAPPKSTDPIKPPEEVPVTAEPEEVPVTAEVEPIAPEIPVVTEQKREPDISAPILTDQAIGDDLMHKNIDAAIEEGAAARKTREREATGRLGREVGTTEKWAKFLGDTKKLIKVVEGQGIIKEEIPFVIDQVAKYQKQITGIFSAISSTRDPLTQGLSETDKILFKFFVKAPFETIKFYHDKKQVVAKILTVGVPFLVESLLQFSLFTWAVGGEAAESTLNVLERRLSKAPNSTANDVNEAIRADQEIMKHNPGFFDRVDEYYTLYNKDGKALIRPGNATEKIINFKKNWGLDRGIEDFREWLTEGMHISEDERTFVDKVFGYAIEFQVPLFGVPMMGYLRHGRLLMRGIEDAKINRSINKYVKDLDTSKSEGSKITSILMQQAQVGKAGKVKGDGQFFYYEGLPAGKQMKPHIYKVSRDKVARSYDISGRLGRLMGAGIFGASSEELLRSMTGADYHKYNYIPYIFAMGGFMAGGQNTFKALTRVPFAASGLVHATTGMGLVPSLAYTAIPAAWGGRAAAGTLYAAGGWTLRGLRVFAEQGGKMDKVLTDKLSGWLHSDFGKALLILSGGGDFGKTWRAYKEARNQSKGARKQWERTEHSNYPDYQDFLKARDDLGQNPLDELLDDVQLPGDQTKTIVSAVRAWSESEFKTNFKALEQLIRQQSELTFKGGVDFANENMIMIGQFLQSSHVRSLQRALLGNHKFNQGIFQKQGIFSSLKGIFSLNRVEAMNQIDHYYKTMDKQNQAILLTMESLRSKVDISSQTKRLVNFMDEELKKNRDWLIHLGNLKSVVRSQFDEIENSAASRELDAKLDETPDQGGFTLEKFSPDVKSPVPLTQRQTLDIINSRGQEFEGAASHLLRSMKATMFREADEMYNKIDLSTPINVDSFVRMIADTSFADSRVVEDLFGPEIPGVGKTASFIAYCKQNFMNMASQRIDPDFSKDLTNELAVRFRDAGWSLVTKRGENLSGSKIEEFFSNILDRLDKNPKSVTALQDLTTIRGAEEAAQDFLDTSMPAILSLKKAKQIRTELWNNVQRQEGTAVQISFNSATEIDKAFIASTENSESVLKQLGFEPEKINETLKELKVANNFYKRNIGELWKTFYGKEIGVSSRMIGELKAPPSVVDRLTSFLLDHTRMYEPDQIVKVSKEGKKKVSTVPPEPYGIMMFKRMFSPDGGDINIMARNVDTGKMETVDLLSRTDAKHQFIRLFQHAIGLRLRNQDREWLLNTPKEYINQLRNAELLNGEQVDTLLRYKEAILQQAKGWEPTKFKTIHNSIDTKVGRLIALENKNTGESFLGELVFGGKFSIAQFVSNLFEPELARSLRGRSEMESALGQGTITEIEEAKKLYFKEFKENPPETMEELKSALGKRLESKQHEIWNNPLEVLLELVETYPKAIDGVEDVVYWHLVKQSFKATDRKITTEELKRVDEKTGLRNTDNNSKSNLLGDGMAQEVDIIKMNELVNKALPILKRIIEFRKRNNLPGTKEREQALNSLENIMEWAKLTKGKVYGEGRVVDMPPAFFRRQIVGRMYSLARGFIHPGYLAAEYSFLHVGTRRAQLLGSILTDPKSMKILENAIIDREEIPVRGLQHLKKVVDRALRGMALTEDEKKQTSLDTPVTWTRKKYRAIYTSLTGRLPPNEERKLKKEARKRNVLERLSGMRGPRGAPTTQMIIEGFSQ